MADPIAVLVPRETVNDDSVKLLAFHVQEGAWVTENQAIADVETSKAVLELEAPREGYVRLVARVGTEVGIGLPICVIGDTPDFPLANEKQDIPAKPQVEEPVLTKAAQPSVVVSDFRGATSFETTLEPALRFTPLAKKMAEDAGLSLEDFRGIRVVRSADVEAVRQGKPLPSHAPKGVVEGPHKNGAVHIDRQEAVPSPIPSSGVNLVWEDLPRRKQVEIKQIGSGVRHVLASSVTVCASTRGLSAAVAKSQVPGISSSAVILFETAKLLKKYPMLNGLYDSGKVGYYQEVNIGWAVDDGSGLMVPVVKDADKKSLPEIASETRDLLERYLMKSLSVQDFVGATFTISDLSSEGVFNFMPLISQGQAAILGIGAEFYLPESTYGLFNITLAFDHQLADGRIASKFLQDLVARLKAYESAFDAGSAEQTLYCAGCNRDADALRQLKAYLVKSEIPAGYVCSICLGGY